MRIKLTNVWGYQFKDVILLLIAKNKQNEMKNKQAKNKHITDRRDVKQISETCYPIRFIIRLSYNSTFKL